MALSLTWANHLLSIGRPARAKCPVCRDLTVRYTQDIFRKSLPVSWSSICSQGGIWEIPSQVSCSSGWLVTSCHAYLASAAYRRSGKSSCKQPQYHLLPSQHPVLSMSTDTIKFWAQSTKCRRYNQFKFNFDRRALIFYFTVTKKGSSVRLRVEYVLYTNGVQTGWTGNWFSRWRWQNIMLTIWTRWFKECGRRLGRGRYSWSECRIYYAALLLAISPLKIEKLYLECNRSENSSTKKKLISRMDRFPCHVYTALLFNVWRPTQNLSLLDNHLVTSYLQLAWRNSCYSVLKTVHQAVVIM